MRGERKDKVIPKKEQRVGFVRNDYTLDQAVEYERWKLRQQLWQFMPKNSKPRLRKDFGGHSLVPPLCIVVGSACPSIVIREKLSAKTSAQKRIMQVGAQWLAEHYPFIYTHAIAAVLNGELQCGSGDIWVNHF